MQYRPERQRVNKHLNLRGEREKCFAEIVDGKHQPDLPRETRKAKLKKAILSACSIFGALHFSCHSTPQSQPNKNSPVPRNTTK